MCNNKDRESDWSVYPEVRRRGEKGSHTGRGTLRRPQASSLIRRRFGGNSGSDERRVGKIGEFEGDWSSKFGEEAILNLIGG